MNLSTSVFRVFIGSGNVDADEPTGVVEDFDWPTHREAKTWLDMGLKNLDTWRRNRQRELAEQASASVANLEWTHAIQPVPVGQMAIIGRDLERQMQVSLAWTRMFGELREIEAQYDRQRGEWLEQYAELVAYLDELEARSS